MTASIFRRMALFFAVLGCVYSAATSCHKTFGDDTPMKKKSPTKLAIPLPNDLDLLFVGERHLQPWIQSYLACHEDFAARNALVFQFPSYLAGWGERFSVLAFNTQFDNETQKAIAHLASAHYSRSGGLADIVACLEDREPRIVSGQLRLLRLARELQADGSDTHWPKERMLYAQRLPKFIVAVLERHPSLGVDVSNTLKEYGQSATKEADQLLHLLLSDDEDVVFAAQTAIRQMDPHGVAKVFELEDAPLTSTQRQRVRDYVTLPPLDDSRESDGSPQREISRQYQVLHRFFRLRGERTANPVVNYQADLALAMCFFDQTSRTDKSGTEWWMNLADAYDDPEFREYDGYRDLLDVFGSVLYSKPGADLAIANLLADDDPKVAEAAMMYVCGLRELRENESAMGAIAGADVMPKRIAALLQRHSHLRRSVAFCLARYEQTASSQADALVPYLLSSDPYDVEVMREAITRINPGLARQLNVELDQICIFDYMPRTQVLSPQQRTLVQMHLNTTE